MASHIVSRKTLRADVARRLVDRIVAVEQDGQYTLRVEYRRYLDVQESEVYEGLRRWLGHSGRPKYFATLPAVAKFVVEMGLFDFAVQLDTARAYMTGRDDG